MRTLIKDLKNEIGKEITVKGWISVRRDQGKMVFFDIRDRSVTAQAVVLPKSAAIEVSKETRLESREFLNRSSCGFREQVSSRQKEVLR